MDIAAKRSDRQLEFHPLVLRHLEPLLALHEKHGIVVESYGPLTPNLRLSEQQNPLKATLAKIAARLTSEAGEKIDENAVLLLWCKAKNVVAVTTSNNPQRLEGLAKIAKLRYGLTSNETKEIDECVSRCICSVLSADMRQCIASEDNIISVST